MDFISQDSLIELEFESTENSFNLEFNIEEDDFNLLFEESNSTTIYFENDHRRLINRDAEDQHSIESIRGLREELDNADASTSRLEEVKLEESDLTEFSNLEIQELWNKIIK